MGIKTDRVLKKGDIVNLRVRLLGGYRGICTVLEDQTGYGPYSLITILPHDGNHTGEDFYRFRGTACRCEMSYISGPALVAVESPC